MSTTAEVAVPATTPTVSEFRCSRCGSPVESEGEHLEMMSRSVLHDIRSGDKSLLRGPNNDIIPANRYCIGCSTTIFNGLHRRNVNPAMVVMLMPDDRIGRYLHKLMPAVRLRYTGECGLTVMSMRWVDKDAIWLLMVDRDAGDFRCYDYQIPKNFADSADGGRPVQKVQSLLISSSTETGRAFIMGYLPQQDMPVFPPPQITLKKGNASKINKPIKTPRSPLEFLDEVADASPSLDDVMVAPSVQIAAPQPWPRPQAAQPVTLIGATGVSSVALGAGNVVGWPSTSVQPNPNPGGNT